MGAKSKRMLKFGISQADAVNKALAAGDAETAVRAATITPWRPLFGQEQAASLLQGAVQQQVAKKLEVITQAPVSVTQPFIQSYAQQLQQAGPISKAQNATLAPLFSPPTAAAAPTAPVSISGGGVPTAYAGPSQEQLRLQAIQQQVLNMQNQCMQQGGMFSSAADGSNAVCQLPGQAVSQDPAVYPSSYGPVGGSGSSFEDGSTSFAPEASGAGGYGPQLQYESVPATSEVYSSQDENYYESGIVDDTAGSSMAYDEGYSRGRGVDESAYGRDSSGEDSGYGFATDAGDFDDEVYGGELEMGNLLGLSELADDDAPVGGGEAGVRQVQANIARDLAAAKAAAERSGYGSQASQLDAPIYGASVGAYGKSVAPDDYSGLLSVLGAAIGAGGQIGTAVLQNETQKQIAKQQAKANQAQQGFFGPVSGGADIAGTILKLGVGAGILFVGYKVVSKIFG